MHKEMKSQFHAGLLPGGLIKCDQIKSQKSDQFINFITIFISMFNIATS